MNILHIDSKCCQCHTKQEVESHQGNKLSPDIKIEELTVNLHLSVQPSEINFQMLLQH